jgi:hypothetical protein
MNDENRLTAKLQMNRLSLRNHRFQFKAGCEDKVETPIHDNIRELVTWECKEHGVNIMNVLANPNESVRRWNLNFWRLEQFCTNF